MHWRRALEVSDDLPGIDRHQCEQHIGVHVFIQETDGPVRERGIGTAVMETIDSLTVVAVDIAAAGAVLRDAIASEDLYLKDLKRRP